MPSTRIINIQASGGDYNDFVTAVNSEAVDLTATDEILIFRIHDDFGGFHTLTGDADFGPYTTDATRYISIEAAPGDECTFTESSGARLRVTSQYHSILCYNGDNIIAKNIVFKQDFGDPGDGDAMLLIGAVEGCMFISSRVTSTKEILSFRDALELHSVHAKNCMFVRAGHLNTKSVSVHEYDPTVFENCTFIGSYVDGGGNQNVNASVTLRNCIVYNTAGTTWNNPNGTTVTADNNAFSDATGVGTNKTVNITTSVFADYAGGDYQPVSTNSVYHNGIGARTFANTIEVHGEEFVLSGNNYTAPGTASDNRMVLIAVAIRDNSDGETIDSVTLGAQAATALTSSYGLSFKQFYTRIFYIREADIPAGANALVITTNTGNVQVNTAFVMTLYNVSQQGVPYFEDPPVTDNNLVTTPKSLTASYGSNSGKFALGLCFNRAGDYDFSVGGTILNDNGWRLGDYDYLAPGQNDVFLRLIQIDSLPDNATQTGWTVDYPDSGTNSNGHPSVFTYALAFEDYSVPVANPTLTINEATVEPGGTITGSYSNFSVGVPPTSPLVISDGTNTISVPITVTENNPADGAGTFTGTLPSLPAAGSSGSFVLFGIVTATLDDA